MISKDPKGFLRVLLEGPKMVQNDKKTLLCLISQENILFVSKSLNNLSTSFFNTWFSFSSDQHNYETSSSTQGNLMKLFYKTNRYGKYSITVSAIELLDKIRKQLKNMLLKNLSPNKIKTVVTNFYLKSY